jgi:hypothetical protein
MQRGATSEVKPDHDCDDVLPDAVRRTQSTNLSAADRWVLSVGVMMINRGNPKYLNTKVSLYPLESLHRLLWN